MNNNITYASVLFEIDQNKKTIINYTRTSASSNYNIYVGIQNKPTRVGSYHDGTSYNGNGGISQQFVPGNGTYEFVIDLEENKLIHDGNEVAISSSISNGGKIYFGIYDGTSNAGHANIKINSFGVKISEKVRADWLQIDLGEEKYIEDLIMLGGSDLRHENDYTRYYGRAPGKYYITGSNDGYKWYYIDYVNNPKINSDKIELPHGRYNYLYDGKYHAYHNVKSYYRYIRIC